MPQALAVIGAMPDALLRREAANVSLDADPNGAGWQLAVRGIDYGVSLAGEEFATGTTVEPFTVPALGEARFDLNVSADLDKAVRLAAQRITERADRPQRPAHDWQHGEHARHRANPHADRPDVRCPRGRHISPDDVENRLSDGKLVHARPQ